MTAAQVLPMSASERLVTFLVGAAVCTSVAVRRRHPLEVGLGVQTSLVVTGVFVSLPGGPVTIAWFCALYAGVRCTTWRVTNG